MSRRRKGPTPKREWAPMRYSHDADDVSDDWQEGRPVPQVWGNDRYTATVYFPPVEGGEKWLTVIGVHSRTRAATGAHDWRHMQRIKNDIAGPEREAVELFPAESRLVDTANEFWLWVLPEGEQFPFGFSERKVAGPEDMEPETQVHRPGHSPAKQRRLT